MHQDCGGEYARLPLEITAHHLHGADLGDDAAHGGDHSRQKAHADLAQQEPESPASWDAQGLDLKRPVLFERAHRGLGDPDDEGKRDQNLRRDHRRSAVHDLEGTERSAAPEQQRHDQADDHGGSAHARVDHRHQGASPGKALRAERDAEGNAEGQGKGERRAADREGAQRDVEDRFGGGSVHGGEDQSAGGASRRSGTKSGCPNRSRPKPARVCCTSGESRWRSNALAARPTASLRWRDGSSCSTE